VPVRCAVVTSNDLHGVFAWPGLAWPGQVVSLTLQALVCCIVNSFRLFYCLHLEYLLSLGIKQVLLEVTATELLVYCTA
jgi:hypothetical protein